MSRFILTVVAVAIYSAAFAGGFFTHTNQNVYFLRNPGSGASSTNIDAVYSNPAGLSFLKNEGLTLSIHNQSAFQTRTATTTFAPFAMNGGSATKEFEGTAEALLIPSVMAAYKWGDLVFSGSFAIVGGGGTLNFDNGLPMLESQVAMLPLMLSEAGIPTNQYSLDSHLKGTVITYGAQLGVTYKMNEHFSGFIGARASFVGNEYEGYVRNIQANIGGGEMQNVNQYFTAAAAQANETAKYASETVGNLQEGIDRGLGGVKLSQLLMFGQISREDVEKIAAGLGTTTGALGNLTLAQTQGALNMLAEKATQTAQTATEVASATTDKELGMTQSGWGIAPIFGLHFNYENLNIGVKYDWNTNIRLTNNTRINTAGLSSFDDKLETDYDIPALLTVGASYGFFDNKLKASLGYHLFLDKWADFAGHAERELDGNTQEFLAGLEYKICDRILVSAGGQLTRQGTTDEFLTDLNFTSDSYSIGVGTQINITKKLSANLAYFLTTYDDYSKENTFGAGSKTVYSRHNSVFGIGLDYRF
jgi:long-subunit fatty acid transport protein